MSSDNPTAVAVRGKLAERRMTQTKAAELLGMAQQGLSRRMNGLQPFTSWELHALAEVLDVEPAELIGERQRRLSRSA